MHSWLIDIARIGIGLCFIAAVILDFKLKPLVFKLMAQKKVPVPNLFFWGAVSWKTLVSIGLIVNFYTFWSALLLALYIFIANIIFNNFWAQPKEQRGFPVYLFFTNLAVCFGLLAVAAAY